MSTKRTMSEEEFAEWKANGNFTISHERILGITNDIAEGIHNTYTKREAAECVTYWSLVASSAIQTEHMAQTEKLIKRMDELTQKIEEKRKAVAYFTDAVATDDCRASLAEGNDGSHAECCDEIIGSIHERLKESDNRVTELRLDRDEAVEKNLGLVNENLQLKRQNAALREVFAELIELDDTISFELTDEGQAVFAHIMKRVKAAIQPDAGHDFIPREQVKPLADAIRAISEAVDKMSRTEDRQELADGFTAAETARRNGLAHAKTLGF